MNPIAPGLGLTSDLRVVEVPKVSTVENDMNRLYSLMTQRCLLVQKDAAFYDEDDNESPEKNPLLCRTREIWIRIDEIEKEKSIVETRVKQCADGRLLPFLGISSFSQLPCLSPRVMLAIDVQEKALFRQVLMLKTDDYNYYHSPLSQKNGALQCVFHKEKNSLSCTQDSKFLGGLYETLEKTVTCNVMASVSKNGFYRVILKCKRAFILIDQCPGTPLKSDFKGIVIISRDGPSNFLYKFNALSKLLKYLLPVTKSSSTSYEAMDNIRCIKNAPLCCLCPVPRFPNLTRVGINGGDEAIRETWLKARKEFETIPDSLPMLSMDVVGVVMDYEGRFSLKQITQAKEMIGMLG